MKSLSKARAHPGRGSRDIGRFFRHLGIADKSVVKTLPRRKAPPVRGTHKDTLWRKGRDFNVKGADILTTVL
jgi:hypothetical protein